MHLVETDHFRLVLTERRGAGSSGSSPFTGAAAALALPFAAALAFEACLGAAFDLGNGIVLTPGLKSSSFLPPECKVSSMLGIYFREAFHWSV